MRVAFLLPLLLLACIACMNRTAVEAADFMRCISDVLIPYTKQYSCFECDKSDVKTTLYSNTTIIEPISYCEQRKSECIPHTAFCYARSLCSQILTEIVARWNKSDNSLLANCKDSLEVVECAKKGDSFCLFTFTEGKTAASQTNVLPRSTACLGLESIFRNVQSNFGCIVQQVAGPSAPFDPFTKETPETAEYIINRLVPRVRLRLSLVQYSQIVNYRQSNLHRWVEQYLPEDTTAEQGTSDVSISGNST